MYTQQDTCFLFVCCCCCFSLVVAGVESDQGGKRELASFGPFYHHTYSSTTHTHTQWDSETHLPHEEQHHHNDSCTNDGNNGVEDDFHHLGFTVLSHWGQQGGGITPITYTDHTTLKGDVTVAEITLTATEVNITDRRALVTLPLPIAHLLIHPTPLFDKLEPALCGVHPRSIAQVASWAGRRWLACLNTGQPFAELGVRVTLLVKLLTLVCANELWLWRVSGSGCWEWITLRENAHWKKSKRKTNSEVSCGSNFLHIIIIPPLTFILGILFYANYWQLLQRETS